MSHKVRGYQSYDTTVLEKWDNINSMFLGGHYVDRKAHGPQASRIHAICFSGGLFPSHNRSANSVHRKSITKQVLIRLSTIHYSNAYTVLHYISINFVYLFQNINNVHTFW